MASQTGCSTSRTRSTSSRPRACATCASSCAFVRNEGIDCELEQTGTLDVATEPWQVEGSTRHVDLRRRTATSSRSSTASAIQAEVHSPRFLAGVRGGTRALRDGQPGEARVGTRGGRRAARRPDRTRTRASAGSTGAPARVDVHVDGGGSWRPDTSRRHVRVQRAGCGASRRCSCRSTTTCWSPSR